MPRNTKTIRTYSELITLPTFEERFRYLKLDGIVGRPTFGYDRWLNQKLYTSKEHKQLRRDIIVRDLGCDLGVADMDIHGMIILHHMNPIEVEDIIEVNDYVWNPEYLICVSDITHKAIHYGTDLQFTRRFAERTPFDTCPWK